MDEDILRLLNPVEGRTTSSVANFLGRDFTDVRDALERLQVDGRAAKGPQGWIRTGTAEHLPFRGSDVEEWLRFKRDERIVWDPSCGERRTREWYVLDELLDDYRLHADTGVPLTGDTNEHR